MLARKFSLLVDNITGFQPTIAPTVAPRGRGMRLMRCLAEFLSVWGKFSAKKVILIYQNNTQMVVIGAAKSALVNPSDTAMVVLLISNNNLYHK